MTDYAVDVTRISREAHRTMAAELTDERVVSVLNDVIATEVVGWLRRTRDALAVRGAGDREVADLFTDHAEQGMQHAVAVAERIAALGGRPNFDPDTLAQRAHTDYSVPAGAELTAMVERALHADRIVVSSYREIAGWLGDRDPGTRRLVESLADDVGRSADALAALLAARARRPS
ncbi:ferritin-like domain-containing protein [Kitasatospora sp. NPDC059571]|uniref:ferritin-like domain-containing protein n=1 Tax=Kitasatospora sp. NPDC059571 TaxID=3346871 RepID=UPI0036907C75